MKENINIKEQATFSNKTPEEIEESFLMALGLRGKPQRSEPYKEDFIGPLEKGEYIERAKTIGKNEDVGEMPSRLKIKFEMATGRKEPNAFELSNYRFDPKAFEKGLTDMMIMSLNKKNPALLNKAKSYKVAELKTSLEKSMKESEGTNTYKEGWSETLNEGLEKMFGKKYEGKWGLNSFFSTDTSKGREFNRKMSEIITVKGTPEAQPKGSLAESHKIQVEEGIPFYKWTQAEKDRVYAERNKEVEVNREAREARK
jgi:hypothetical protein